MALLRIKNPEQLKQCKPGEIGRIIGLDRIPEVKCLRSNLFMLTAQHQTRHLNIILVDHWYSGDSSQDADFLYIGGHIRIYYGDKANLSVKYVSRQKFCLSATTEYWVNDAQGMPLMMVMRELTEKLQTVSEHQIIPQLQQTILLSQPPANKDTPVCTFIFDREAYEPAFYHRLWENHKTAIITYRKNIKDRWPVECFKNATLYDFDKSYNVESSLLTPKKN